jgi:hypothetical protein
MLFAATDQMRFRPAVMTVMPIRKSPTPQSTEMTVDMLAPVANDNQVSFSTVA